MVEVASEIRWQDKRFEVPLERIMLTEKWGYDAVFTPEGFGAECLIPAGYLAGHVKHMTIGTRILQVTGRAPAKAVESFQGLNHLTGGNRIIAGLGSGTPMQCEGLEGKPWGNPVKRMRDYVTILRQGFAGKPLDHQGSEWSAPYRGPGNKGLAPMTNGLEIISDIPIMIAAAHPQMVSLAAELSEGWFPPSWAPSCLPHYMPMLEKGFAAAGNGKSMKDFKIWVQLDSIVDNDVRKAMRPFKEYTVSWAHLQKEIMEARGYKGLCERLMELTEAGKTEQKMLAGENALDDKYWEEAIAAVPDEYIDEGWLVGPVERMREKLKPWLDCGVTGLIIRQGAPFDHERINESMELYKMVAEEAGKEPRG
ncbi:MAG: LLM class flavin-dependent oxidoreductase [Sphingomonadales bacterium]|nr:MAG: LLM class flavin-dependent oxidoreductase [Sphingomonadales bacterium]